MSTKRRVAFLFLGETLLIPHLWPIAEALAAAEPSLPIDLWVATSMHEALLTRWLAELPPHQMRVRRAPGFRVVPEGAEGGNPKLPAKLPMLLRMAPRLWRTRVAVCAEQTSLWLPRLLPFMPTRFVKTSHGVGSMSARDDPRRRAAWVMLVPSERERATYLARGFDPERVLATGYVKASFRQRSGARAQFAEARPVILYNPHWQRHRSSWWAWGEAVIDAILAEGRWNLIFAPHQRLVEKAPEVREVAARIAGRPDVVVDLDSFAAVDGSWPAAADIYLGDTSSQVLEFLVEPRPAVFLNAGGADWRGDVSYAMWATGTVVESIDELSAALESTLSSSEIFRLQQTEFVRESLGDTTGAAPMNAVAAIRAALDA